MFVKLSRKMWSYEKYITEIMWKKRIKIKKRISNMWNEKRGLAIQIENINSRKYDIAQLPYDTLCNNRLGSITDDKWRELTRFNRRTRNTWMSGVRRRSPSLPAWGHRCRLVRAPWFIQALRRFGQPVWCNENGFVYDYGGVGVGREYRCRWR